MSKVIAHIDLNAFFVTAEEIRNPSLINKPVAIGHEGRGGIVSTCSYTARKYGVSSGMPMFQAKQKCPNLIIVPVDFRYYKSLSAQFYDFMKRQTNLVEMVSIDECFVDFTEVIKNIKNPIDYFKKLQNDLLITTGLKCSIGIAPTKFLAKMASDYKKPMGITIIRRNDIEKIIYPLPIEDMFGIGKKTTPILRQKEINTIGDLANKIINNDNDINNILGKNKVTLETWLKGYGSDTINLDTFNPKSIGRTKTLTFNTDNFDIIKKYLSEMAEEISKDAIKEKKYGTTIQVIIKEDNFVTHSKSVTLEKPFNKSDILYNEATKIYQKHFLNYSIRLVGITLQNLQDYKTSTIQMSLFENEEFEPENETKLLINDLNRKISKPILIRASELKEKKNGNN